MKIPGLTSTITHPALFVGLCWDDWDEVPVAPHFHFIGHTARSGIYTPRMVRVEPAFITAGVSWSVLWLCQDQLEGFSFDVDYVHDLLPCLVLGTH